MNFEETLSTIEWAKKLHGLTDDVMLRESIKILAPLLAVEERQLSLQEQNALTYVSNSIRQYRALFGPQAEIRNEPLDERV